jgi:hypothetical protein
MVAAIYILTCCQSLTIMQGLTHKILATIFITYIDRYKEHLVLSYLKFVPLLFSLMADKICSSNSRDLPGGAAELELGHELEAVLQAM